MSFLTDETLFAATLSDSDLLHIVDVSNTTQNPDGSSFKLTIGQLKAVMPNIYNINGTLTGDRTVLMAGNYLSFQGGQTGFGTVPNDNTIVHVKGVNSTNLNYQIVSENSSGRKCFFVRNDGAALIQSSLVVNSNNDDGLISDCTFGIVNNKTYAFEIYNGFYARLLRVTSSGHLLIGTVPNDYAVMNIKGSTSDDTAKAIQIQNVGNFDILIGRNDGLVSMPLTPSFVYANNAAAISGGLVAGDLYVRTGHGLDIVV